MADLTDAPFAVAGNTLPIERPLPDAPFAQTDPARVGKMMRGNLAPKVPAPQQVTGFQDALEAGLQVSVSGLIARGQAPDKALSPDAPWYSRAAAGAANLAGDFPAMLAGGALATGATAGRGGGIAAMAGAFALPAGLRATLMDAYTNGDIKTFGEFWDRSSNIMYQTAKAWLTGAATGVAGKFVAGALPVGASTATQVVAPTAAELATMVTVGSALEGHAPRAQDFMDAALVLAGGKAAVSVAGKLRQVYSATGRTPAEVVADATRDPEIKAELTGAIVPVRGTEPVQGPTVTAYHGSPHDFEAFDATKIGTGEGAQAYGHGLYFAENPEVAGGYQKRLATNYLDANGAQVDYGSAWQSAMDAAKASGVPHPDHARAIAGQIQDWVDSGKQAKTFLRYNEVPEQSKAAYKAAADAWAAFKPNPGSLYKVEIPQSTVDRMLDWDKPLSEQPEILNALNATDWLPATEKNLAQMTGQDLYRAMSERDGKTKIFIGDQKKVSDYLHEIGVPGIRYLDHGSRNKTRWVAKHPQGGENDFADEASARAFINRNPEYTLVAPDQTRNFVLFDDSLAKIVEKNGIPTAYRDLANQELGRQIVPGVNAEAVAAKPFADILPQAPGEPAKPTHVNYDLINTAEDTKLALARVSEVYEKDIQAQRRGTVSWEETSTEAAKLLSDTLGGVDPKLLMPREPGTAAGAAEILARKQLTVGAAEDMMRARDELLAKGSEATLEDRLQFTASIERLAMIQSEFLGARAEAGRALNILKSTAIEADRARQIEDVIRMYGKDPMTLATMMKEIDNPAGAAKFAREAVKATTWEKIVEAWKAGILSGPVTHVANVMGNTIFMALRTPIDAVAAGIGSMRGGTDRVMAAEPLARVAGELQGSLDGLRLAWSVLKTGEQPGKSEQYRKAISGVKGEVIRLPFRALSAEDSVFTTMNQRGEAMALATRQATIEGLNPLTREFRERVADLVQNPPTEMAAAVEEAGKRLTFNTELGEKGRAVQDFVRAWHLEWAIPFIRTPANIIKELGRMTPAAPLVKEWRDAMAKPGAERDKAIAELAVGTAITSTVFMFALDGLVTGAGEPDPAKRRVQQAAGWQPYSVKVGDTYYSYQRLQPVGTLMGLAADVSEVWDHLNEEEADKVPKMLSVAFANAVTNQTFLQGITNIVNAMSDPKRFGPKFAQSFAGSLVPNIVGQTTAMNDPIVREVDSMLDAVKARIPGARDSLLPKRDVFGEPIQTKERLGGLSPITESVDTTDKVRSEADRLNLGASDAVKKIHIGRGSGKIGDVKLTPEERDRYGEVSGHFAHAMLTPIVNAPSWEGLPDLAKRKVYERVFVAAHRFGALAAIPEDKRAGLIKEITETVAAELQPE